MQICFQCEERYNPQHNHENACVYHPHEYRENEGWLCCGLLEETARGCITDHHVALQELTNGTIVKEEWDDKNEVIVGFKNPKTDIGVKTCMGMDTISKYFDSMKPLLANDTTMDDDVWIFTLKNRDDYQAMLDTVYRVDDVYYIEKNLTHYVKKL